MILLTFLKRHYFCICDTYKQNDLTLKVIQENRQQLYNTDIIAHLMFM